MKKEMSMGPTTTRYEDALIGSMLINPACRPEALRLVSPENLSSERSREIFEAFASVGDGDYLALHSELQRRGFIKGNGDADKTNEYLVSLINTTGTSTGIEQNARTINEAANRRKAITVAKSIIQDAQNMALDIGDTLERRVENLKSVFEEQKEAANGKPEQKSLNHCVLGLEELLKKTIQEKNRLLPWLPEGGLAMVYGPRGIGKTYCTLTLAAAVCSGSPFMKWSKPGKPVGVLIIDGEMALSALQSRITQLLITPPVKPLKILSGEEVFSEIDLDINLANDRHQKDVLSILENEPSIRLVIIDNISCLFSGLRESSKDDWEQVTPWLLAMRRRGVAVLLVHHAGKDGGQRGTSGREDLLDTVISLERVHGGKNSGAQFIVKFTKCRGTYGADIEPFEASLDLNNPELWTWKPLEESTYERMLDLAKNGVSSVTDMAEELSVTKGHISRLKKRGIESGDLIDSRFILLEKHSDAK